MTEHTMAVVENLPAAEYQGKIIVGGQRFGTGKQRNN